MPSAFDVVRGLPHHSDQEREQGKLWNVVRAIASTKMHYKARIESYMDLDDREFPFIKLWPDTSQASGGNHPLSDLGLQVLYSESIIKNHRDFLKHILTMHDGEARIVIDDGYKPLPYDVDVHNARFWQYQFARTLEVRQWLYKRSLNKNQSECPLTDDDIKWILKVEKNRTLLLEWEPWWPSNPAYGGNLRLEKGSWKIRAGNYITLAELFKLGAYKLTCFHLYTMYLNLDVYIQRRNHSLSTSDNAVTRQNAKALHYHETYQWGLPSETDSWVRPEKNVDQPLAIASLAGHAVDQPLATASGGLLVGRKLPARVSASAGYPVCRNELRLATSLSVWPHQ